MPCCANTKYTHYLFKNYRKNNPLHDRWRRKELSTVQVSTSIPAWDVLLSLLWTTSIEFASTSINLADLWVSIGLLSSTLYARARSMTGGEPWGCKRKLAWEQSRCRALSSYPADAGIWVIDTPPYVRSNLIIELENGQVFLQNDLWLSNTTWFDAVRGTVG